MDTRRKTALEQFPVDLETNLSEQDRAKIADHEMIVRLVDLSLEQSRILHSGSGLLDVEYLNKEQAKTIEQLRAELADYKDANAVLMHANEKAEAKLEQAHSLLSRIHHDSRTDYVKSLANEVNAYFESIAGEGD